MQNLKEVLNKWFKGVGKPNSITGEWDINQVINYRAIMGSSHNMQVYTALGDEENWDKVNINRSRNDNGNIKQVSRMIKFRHGMLKPNK